jgi:predicted transcriptional regulator
MDPMCDIMTCEMIARQYLPSMRAELVYRLVRERGVSQSRVADWMGITRAAVSQYLNKKRGSGLGELSEDVDAMLEIWAEGVISGDGGITICDLCQCVRAPGNYPQFSQQFTHHFK